MNTTSKTGYPVMDEILESIAPPQDGRRTLWIGNEPNPDDRLQIDVSADDYAKVPPRGKGRVGVEITLTDLRTNRKLIVVGAECGCSSPCALELVRWLDDDKQAQTDAPPVSEHTPLPWRIAGGMIDGYAIVGADNSEVLPRQSLPPYEGYEGDLRFITVAVNNHEALVAVLEQARRTISDLTWNRKLTGATREKLERVATQAEAVLARVHQV